MSVRTVTIGASNNNQNATILVQTIVNVSSSNWEGQPTYQCNMVSNTNSIWQVDPFQITNGKQTFTVPTGAAGVIIECPANPPGTIKIATSNTDTGIFIHPSAGAILYFDQDNLPTSLYITGNAAGGGYILRWL